MVLATCHAPPPLSPVTIANTPLQPHGSDGCITPPPPPPSYLTSPRTSNLMAVTVASSPPPLPPVISPLQGPPASWR